MWCGVLYYDISYYIVLCCSVLCGAVVLVRLRKLCLARLYTILCFGLGCADYSLLAGCIDVLPPPCRPGDLAKGNNRRR